MTKQEPSRITITISLVAFLFLIYFLPTFDAYYVGDEQENRSGKTIIVNATGGGDYTRIQWAVDNASDGDTVLVDEGIYLEQITINKSISLIGTIDECIIDGNRSGTVITVSSNGVGIMGFTIKGSGGDELACGILLDTVQNCTISGNNISKNSRGISLYGYNNNIENNMLYGNGMSGIILSGSDNTLSNNTVIHSETGILVYGSSNIIANNIIKLGLWGIHLDSSDGNVVTNNVCRTYQDGIYLSDSNRNTISNNECSFNTHTGIQLYDSKKNKIISNICISNGQYGIYIVDHDSKGNADGKGAGNKLSGNICESNGEANIYYESDEDEDWIFKTIIIAMITIIVGSLVFQLLLNAKRKS